MGDFSIGDTVEYVPSMQDVGRNDRYIGVIERCWGPGAYSSVFSAPNACEIRITKAQINPRSTSYAYKPGDTMLVHKLRLRRIRTSPNNLNRTRKTLMQKELKALPPIDGFPFPGGVNYHAARSATRNAASSVRDARNNAQTHRKYRRNKWNSIINSLPKQPPGGFEFEGGKRRSRSRPRRKV